MSSCALLTHFTTVKTFVCKTTQVVSAIQRQEVHLQVSPIVIGIPLINDIIVSGRL